MEVFKILEDFLGLSTKENTNYKNNIIQMQKHKNRIIKNINEAINLTEIERLAISKLDSNALSYYISGANNEYTLHRNLKFYKKNC